MTTDKISPAGEGARPGEACCDPQRAVQASTDELNAGCHCLEIDDAALRSAIETRLGQRGLSAELAGSHPHLFAVAPLFVSRADVDAMAGAIRAIETVVSQPGFRAAALAWAPESARVDPGSPGGLLGFDFHLTADGPRLIEINTNPGGAMLCALLARAYRACCEEARALAMVPLEPSGFEDALFAVFMDEWRRQRGSLPLRTIAIVDQAPTSQYLYPEFLLYQRLFRERGVECLICDPGELTLAGDGLRHGEHTIDFVYNRLTDFALALPEHALLRRVWLEHRAVVSPHPFAHALYADKRNLGLLSDPAFLRSLEVDAGAVERILSVVPRTELVTSDNRDALWAARKNLFFKPATGFGSRAAYRGDKLTRRVWDEIAGAPYVAQALVPAGERQILTGPDPRALKADVRCYAYAGEPKLYAARLYQGQTTNFRTPGGGFAPVFTRPR